MSFPSSPYNGQVAKVNNISYQYNSTVNRWQRLLGTVTSATALTNGTYTVTLSTSGALTLSNGGLTIPSGGISVNGPLVLNGTLAANSPGFLGMPQNTINTATYTLALTDQGKHLYDAYVGTTAITIPANTLTNFPVGSTIAIIASPNTTATISCSDFFFLGGSGSTGTRTLAPYGMASIVKVTNTTWFISGLGLS
jgi:hypothetical protein